MSMKRGNCVTHNSRTTISASISGSCISRWKGNAFPTEISQSDLAPPLPHSGTFPCETKLNSTRLSTSRRPLSSSGTQPLISNRGVGWWSKRNVEMSGALRTSVSIYHAQPILDIIFIHPHWSAARLFTSSLIFFLLLLQSV